MVDLVFIHLLIILLEFDENAYKIPARPAALSHYPFRKGRPQACRSLPMGISFLRQISIDLPEAYCISLSIRIASSHISLARPAIGTAANIPTVPHN